MWENSGILFGINILLAFLQYIYFSFILMCFFREEKV